VAWRQGGSKTRRQRGKESGRWGRREAGSVKRS
jgi:hypothetical protein